MVSSRWRDTDAVLRLTLPRSLGQQNLNYGQALKTLCPLIIVIVTQWIVPQGRLYRDTLTHGCQAYCTFWIKRAAIMGKLAALWVTLLRSLFGSKPADRSVNITCSAQSDTHIGHFALSFLFCLKTAIFRKFLWVRHQQNTKPTLLGPSDRNNIWRLW
jgi:hypothetical protein